MPAAVDMGKVPMEPYGRGRSGLERSTQWECTMRSSSIAVFSFVLLSGYPAQASVIATYDFEDGTVQGWTSFNNASAPFNSTAEAFSGTHSLLTSVNSTGGGGPSISLNTILVPGAK